MFLTVKKVIEKLESGQVGVMPFDTVWGLGGLMTEEVVKRMAALKHRSAQKPFLMLIPNKGYLHKVAVEIPEYAIKLMNKYWPGPMTLIFKKSPQIPDYVTASKDTVAVR
ncbi:MAG: Sua5/YciO/YrdC/YwlC family protein, partial [Candidatus Margulisbacteria bacterium]|nr:Sua5/YciO/YrdC/YwlC family protein [Candidatus Margulisiibacteriota bacterium]